MIQGTAGRKVWAAGITAGAAAVFAFLYLPIAVIVVFSFNRFSTSLPLRGLTLDWYRLLFQDRPLIESLLHSFLVAGCAVVIAVVIGIPAALAVDRLKFPGKELFERVVLLPLILPGIITGVSLLNFFVAGGIRLSLTTVILGHGTALISVVVTQVYARLKRMDRSQEEAAMDLGAPPWRTFWHVTFPNIRTAVLGAALLVFTLSMDEIAVTFFLIGRENTLPLAVWSMLRQGITPEVNAISTIIFLMSAVAILLGYRLMQKET
mgnify:CR=1 FL=1